MDSLRPDEALMNALVDGDPRAREIVDAWRFRFPITEMTPQALEELTDRCRTAFSFPRADEGERSVAKAI